MREEVLTRMRYMFEDSGEEIEMTLHENGLACDFTITNEIDDLLYSGFVKWDGCVNWEPDGMAHFCGPTDIDRLKVYFLKIWEMGREMMGDKCDTGCGK